MRVFVALGLYLVSVMELFMAGGNYPVAEVPFPKEFVAVVQTEMDAAKHAL